MQSFLEAQTILTKDTKLMSQSRKKIDDTKYCKLFSFSFKTQKVLLLTKAWFAKTNLDLLDAPKVIPILTTRSII